MKNRPSQLAGAVESVKKTLHRCVTQPSPPEGGEISRRNPAKRLRREKEEDGSRYGDGALAAAAE